MRGLPTKHATASDDALRHGTLSSLSSSYAFKQMVRLIGDVSGLEETAAQNAYLAVPRGRINL